MVGKNDVLKNPEDRPQPPAYILLSSQTMYSVIRRFLFLFDAESVHYFTMNCLSAFCRIPFAAALLKRIFSPPDLPTNAFGIRFKNPVGLAAGFDKNAKYLRELAALGFGFIEIGTVTPLPQSGNPKPRLFRLPKDKAIINRMGFNNDGAEVIAQRLRKFRKEKNDLIIGGNIGKNKLTANEEAWKDYEKCFLALYDLVDYFVVNVSSPNTPGLRDLQQKDLLKKILTHLQNLRSQQSVYKPVLLKIAPDLNDHDLLDICNLALEINLDGLVVNNTTIGRENCITPASRVASIGAGGLSGHPLTPKSNEILKKVVQQTENKIPVIGTGGVMSPGDAMEKLNAGASLVQLFTGFIYGGPGIVKRIVRAF